MMENSFEKQIADKLKNTEVQPSEHLLDSIFEKRAAKPKRFAVNPFAGAVLGIAILAAISCLVWLDNAKSKEAQVSVSLEVQDPKTVKESKAIGKFEDIVPNKAENSVLPDENLSSIAQETNKISSGNKQSRSKSIVKEPFENKEASKPVLVQNNAEIENQYFNLGKGERPVLQKVEHQGNSHLYVFQTIGDEALLNRDFLFSRIVRLHKMAIKKNIESIEMVETKPVKRNGPGKNKRPIYLDFMFNPSINMVQLSGENSLVEAGQALSKSSLNQSFGLRVSIPIKAKWNVYAGLNYREQSNQYKGLLLYNKEQTQINQQIKYINDPIKGVVKIVTYDTVKFQASNSQSVNFKNQYKIFQLPLGFSYNFGYKQLDFSINGSALFNYIKSSQGQNILLDQHIVLPYSSNKGTIGFGAGLSVMGAYKLNNRIRLIAEPGLQYFGLKSMHFGNSLKENVISPQLTIGLRYTLF